MIEEEEDTGYLKILEKGRTLMQAMTHFDLEISPMSRHIGEWLWEVKDGGLIPPWVEEGLRREGYVEKDFVREQIDTIEFHARMQGRFGRDRWME